jgi:hypothetical protein
MFGELSPRVVFDNPRSLTSAGIANVSIRTRGQPRQNIMGTSGQIADSRSKYCSKDRLKTSLESGIGNEHLQRGK